MGICFRTALFPREDYTVFEDSSELLQSIFEAAERLSNVALLECLR